MKKYSFILVILACISCATPSRLGMNYKGKKIYNSSSAAVDNKNIDVVVNSLTKADVGDDVKGLKNRLIPFIYKNEVLNNLMHKYPDLKIQVEISPSEQLKRTWILDVLFFYPGCGALIPITPWWGSTDLSAKMSVSIPNDRNTEFKFNSSEPFKILWYPYYNAGRILTEKYSVAYNNLFEQISTYNFNELADKAVPSSSPSIPSASSAPTNIADNRYSFKHKSDIDKDIPNVGVVNKTRFALIIGNEDYASQQSQLTAEANVEFARNDASAFKEYAIHTLGIPEGNITFILDATTGKMKQDLDRMRLLAKNSGGVAELFFYYAGHGLPDEITKEPYLIPVDVSGNNVTDGIKLTDAYKMLTENPSKRVTVFLDACFTGGARSQGLIAARGVKIKPKEDLLNGNLVVFTSSSGEQSSLAFKEKEHGLFTYFLLKKIKDTKGNVTYKELSDYLNQQIGLNSVLINSKEQNPQTNVSPEIQNQWQTWKFR